MRTDHAIVINHSKPFCELLDYLARKANRLGLQGREIVRVYIHEDAEGKHLYLESENKKGQDIQPTLNDLQI